MEHLTTEMVHLNQTFKNKASTNISCSKMNCFHFPSPPKRRLNSR